MKLFTSLILLIFVSVSIAQDRMTPEMLWDLKRVGGIQISPDNSTILFSMREYNLENNNGSSRLYTMPVGGGEMTQLEIFGAYSAQWRPDGKKIVFMKANLNGMNILEVNPDGTDEQMVSDFRDGGIGGFKYSPDGSRVLFIKDIKMNKVHSTEYHEDLDKSNARVIDDLMYRHWSTWDDGTRSHVFYADLKEGKIIGEGIDIMDGENFNSPVKPFGGMEQITFSPDGSTIVYVCKKMNGLAFATSTNTDLFSYDIASKTTINISGDNKGYDMEPQYSADGKWLAWLSMEKDGFEADKNDIILYNIENKERVNLTADYDMTVASFVWDNNGENIYFKSVIEATYQLFNYDIANRSYRQLTAGIHNYTSLSFAGDKLIAGRQSMNHPTDIYSVDIKSGEQKQLTDANKETYDKIKTGDIEKRWVTTTDGKKELVWVIYPPDFDKTKKYPALLYCQGGPQSAVSQFFSYRWNFQLMAANDYIIIAPNRRGLPGFGQEWNDAISGDWGGQAIDDYLSAIDEIKKEPFIDEDRIGSIGASYGGYSVYYLAGMHEKRFKCFISHCGLFNLESWYGTTEELFFANEDIGGHYYQATLPEGYQKNSPHKMVHKWDTPMLIFHGEQDFRVPVNQGLEAFQACQIMGVPSKLILFPEENHWVLSPQNGVFWHREFYAWLDTYLK